MLLVFGSINLDISVPTQHLPSAGETVMGGAARLSPGGKGANQAHAAQRFGVTTRLVGRVGSDVFAAPALAGLRDAGVDLQGVAVSPDAPTGLALITVDANGDNCIVVAPGANLSTVARQVSDEVLQEARVLLLQLEVPPAQSFELARRARRFGCRVMLNASPLPRELDEHDEALDVLIVNRIELDMLCARHGIAGADASAQAARLAQALAMQVLLTQGAQGALLASTDGRLLTEPALPIRAVDTTGAGDAFAGVFAAAIAGGEAPARALRLAAAAGGLACLHRGTQLAHLDRRAIEQAIDEGPP